jgi:hypothetical protein
VKLVKISVRLVDISVKLADISVKLGNISVKQYNKIKRLTLPRIFFTRGGSELLVAYPLPSLSLAPPSECQRFISYQSERYTSRGFTLSIQVPITRMSRLLTDGGVI